MKHFSFSCQGESHKLINKPCQDNSISYSEKGLSIAVICDGHGGDRYFRSDIGSRLCVNITIELIKEFVCKIDKSLFVNKPFTQKKTIGESEVLEKLNDADQALRHLFSSIIFKWNSEIELHADANPPTESEINKVNPNYIGTLINKISLEKIYGCTLMAYVLTPDYWFAFHLGDGKCISFHEDESQIWKEPIPWDEKCFLNKTTSMCDSAALDEFRYCYQGNGDFPIAVFLGSDGMDDSFGTIENLVDFYMQIAKLLSQGNDDNAQKDIEETLPILSKKGSQDDMSLACIYDIDRLKKFNYKILSYQIDCIEKQLMNVQCEIDILEDKVKTIENTENQKAIIERNYAIKDIERLTKTVIILKDRLNVRNDELKQLYPDRKTMNIPIIDKLKRRKRNLLKKRKKRKHRKDRNR